MADGLRYRVAAGCVRAARPDMGCPSRAEAEKLPREGGAEGLSFELLNRNVNQPYKYVGTWLVDEWQKIGVQVTQRMVPTGGQEQVTRIGTLIAAFVAMGLPKVHLPKHNRSFK